MIAVPIVVDNLNILRPKILKYFPWQKITQIASFYLPKDSLIFLDINELREMLTSLGFFQYVHSFSFGVQRPHSTGGIHVDDGESSFSFNLPLYNCEKTFVAFYHCSKEIERKEYFSLGRKIFYSHCDPNYCTEIKRVEMNQPHVINVHMPHSVINPTSTFRITFLIRMLKEFDEFWCPKRESNP